MRTFLGWTLIFLFVFVPIAESAVSNQPNDSSPWRNPQPATIVITSPSGGENWTLGTSHTIFWSYTGNPGATVRLVLLKAMNPVATLVQNWPVGNGGKGSYSWTIDPKTLAGPDYRFLIQSESSNVKTTGNTFGLVASATISSKPDIIKGPVTTTLLSVSVELPKAGPEPYVPGWPLPVKWKYIGTPPGLARILLLKGDQVVATLHTGTSWGSGGEGTFNAIMPADQFGFVLYKVKVVSTSNAKYDGLSDEFIAMPLLKVTNPSANGQKWNVGQTPTFSWKYSGGCGNTLGVKAILTNDQWAYDLKSDLPIGTNWQGSFNWPIPDSIPAGEYRLYFQSSTGVCSDRSPSFFVVH